MTEFWVSQKMHWCDYCKCWLKDTPSARMHHEQGLKHKQAVATHIANTKKKAMQEKKEHDMALKSMAKLERMAKQQYERDLEAGVLKGDAEQVHDEPIGPSLPSKAEDLRGWYLDKDSGYYYHDGAGWYYHRDSGMYYGGDPQEWKSELPEDKRHLSFPKNRLPTVAANDVLKTVTVRRAEVTKHPLSRIGGHQAPSMRSLQSKGGPEKGGADKGDAGNAPAHRAGAAAREAALKRKRDPEREAALAREEEEFRRQKEAAKMRNEQRTKERWGLA